MARCQVSAVVGRDLDAADDARRPLSVAVPVIVTGVPDLDDRARPRGR